MAVAGAAWRSGSRTTSMPCSNIYWTWNPSAHTTSPTTPSANSCPSLPHLEDKRNFYSWTSNKQRDHQCDQLFAAFAYTNDFVRVSRGKRVWKHAEQAERKTAFRACFDEAPLWIRYRFFELHSRCFNIFQIFGADPEKIPEVVSWRNFIREVFVDLCDKAYCFIIRSTSEQDKKHSQWLWKWMTHTDKYSAKLEQLGDVCDVPTYRPLLYCEPNTKCRDKLEAARLGDPALVKKRRGGFKGSKRTGKRRRAGQEEEVAGRGRKRRRRQEVDSSQENETAEESEDDKQGSDASDREAAVPRQKRGRLIRRRKPAPTE